MLSHNNISYSMMLFNMMFMIQHNVSLYRVQRARTIKAACTIATLPSTTNGSMHNTHTDNSLDNLDLTVRSLSHVRLIVGTLKAALWTACDSDPQQVCVSECVYVCMCVCVCMCMYV
jgi:hypothetical protein